MQLKYMHIKKLGNNRVGKFPSPNTPQKNPCLTHVVKLFNT
jgi:hypothetical protein